MYMYSTVHLNKFSSDAAVVLGMILLNEANNLKGDAGKKRSKLIKIASRYILILYTYMCLQVCINMISFVNTAVVTWQIYTNTWGNILFH